MKKLIFLPNENIVVSYSIASEQSIVDYDYSQSGFNIMLMNIDENNSRIVIELSCIANSLEYAFNISVELDNGDNCVASLYAINNEHGVFISPFSADNAFERYCEYAIQNNILTEEQAAKLFMDSFKGTVEEYVTVEYNTSSEPTTKSILLSETESAVYCGYLRWRDDNNINHPLRKVKVEIYSQEENLLTLLDTQCTNNDGYFEFEIPAETDTFIRVYAGDSNAIVKSPVLETSYYYDYDDYYDESEISYGTPAGVISTYHATFCMDNDLGKAFQISQAILTARDYAEIMMNERPSDVLVLYPYDGEIEEEYDETNKNGCYYDDVLKIINITGRYPINDNSLHSYASWDVIMHEYGHHIQNELGINKSTGGEHVFDANLCDSMKNKDKGMRLAWAEAWATVFGMQAQEYFSTYLQDIDFINDGTYDAYNFNAPHPIEENTDFKGDGCEATIIAVLWDLYDNHPETNDWIALGHRKYWNVTTYNQIKTFSDFINYFYEQYPEYTYDLGRSLSYYGMASTSPAMTNSSNVSQIISPTFTWNRQGGRDNVADQNNSFVLIILDGRGNEILRTASITSTTYSLTQSEWNEILHTCGDTYIAVVSAMQTAYPTTGPYISKISDYFTKPPVDFEVHTYTDHYSQLSSSQHIAYCECGEYVLQDHNYTDYANITDSHHTAVCVCGAVASTQEAHVATRCVSNGSSLHSIYCKCGYLISHDLHEMLIIDLRYSKCMYCGYVRDNSVPGQIIMGVEDEAETSEE